MFTSLKVNIKQAIFYIFINHHPFMRKMMNFGVNILVTQNYYFYAVINDKSFLMNKHLISISFLLIVNLGIAQVIEGFSDGDFLNNPSWSGNTEHFIVNDNLRLQLQNEGNEAVSYLQTANSLVDSTSWEFFIKLSFSPSGNNNARVYLVTDQNDLTAPLNGYFLQFGEALSEDAIELFRQNGEEITSICRGMNGTVSSSFEAKIKVEHKLNGDWLVYSDFDQTGEYVLECSGNDASINQTHYFGFFCKYTSSNSTKFYFDDIEIKNLEVDTEAPEVESLIVENENTLSIAFSEIVTEEAEHAGNYTVNNGQGTPLSAVLNTSGNEVTLNFGSNFELDVEYEIQIQNIRDLNGNTMPTTTRTFKRSVLEPYDVVINEIMADPNPVVQLPNVEYLEIYNRSETVIDLSNWTLMIGDAERAFPEASIEAGGYKILCKNSNASELTSYGEVIGFGSFSLTNGGQCLTLLDATGQDIHFVEYSDDWYRDSEKEDGGWSLEQINPNDFCSSDQNWIASNNEQGGTPGIINSVYSDEPVQPEILSLEVADNPLLLLSFSQQMNLNDLLQKSNYHLNPGNIEPSQILVYDTSTAVYLVFNDLFELGKEYELVVDGSMENCAGQLLSVPQSISFMLPKPAEIGEVLINEIMADPEPVVALPAYEYVELHNRANAPVVLNNWQLQIGSTKKLIETAIIQANGYLILCDEDAAADFSEFGQVYGFSSLSLTNSGAQILLKNEFGGIIHQLEYSDDWYNDESKAEGGWSLEAIDPVQYCQEKGNWAASINSRGGTPGSINSVDGVAADPEELSIRQIEILSESSIRVTFSDKMDSVSLSVPDRYWVNQDVGYAIETTIEAPKYLSVSLFFDSEFEKGIIYQLEIENGLLSCDGRDAGGLMQEFALADQVKPGDVVFNEILFDPVVDDGDFMELVNISDKIIEPSDLAFSRVSFGEYDTTWYTTDLQGPQLFPGDYLAFTPSSEQVLKVYHSENPERIISNDDFPGLPNSDGNIRLHLQWNKDSIIDQMIYDEDMHHSLLKVTKGVSLEKINLIGGNSNKNWHSAASSVNYGTPAYQNSQYLEAETATTKFELSPEVFSPDNDGFEDVLQISYKLDEPGYMLNVVIYDSRGREVKKLIQNELLGTKGSFIWNGEDENHEKANMGIYILLFEYYDLNGNVKTEKKTTVLGGKL